MMVQGVAKPARGLDFASKVDVRLGSICRRGIQAEVRSTPKADISDAEQQVRFGPILLQKSVETSREA
jgi:hypothetical protein